MCLALLDSGKAIRSSSVEVSRLCPFYIRGYEINSIHRSIKYLIRLKFVAWFSNFSGISNKRRMYLIDFFKKSRSTLLFLLLFSVFFLPILYFLVKPKDRLPVYNPVDVNPRLVDDSVKHISRNHRIAGFDLVNQNGKQVTEEDFKGKIYVADFFFTRCQTICPIMAVHMKDLQEHYRSDPELKFLSHSVTPVMDSVPVLRAYADKNGAIDGKWEITTGDKKHIYNLARKSYFAVLDEGDGGDQDFIHTEQFILVDKKGRIRGFYDGTEKEEMQRIIDDVAVLKAEE